jgi:hypothetical protein
MKEKKRMAKSIAELPAVLTCFAYRNEYFAEMENMLVTIREHHPDWPIVVGRGPVSDVERPVMEIESPSGKSLWTFPLRIELDGSENDWRKLTRMKAWWMAEVWRNFGSLTGANQHRIVWLDADARLNGPLDIELEPETETVAGPWWYDPKNSDHDTICTSLLVFQGSKGGVVEKIIEQWSTTCQSHIQDMRPPTVPWLDSDQEVLSAVTETFSDSHYNLLRLEHDRYAANVNDDGTALPGALIDQWLMSRKTKRPESRGRDWPPPEEERRRSTEKRAGD